MSLCSWGLEVGRGGWGGEGVANQTPLPPPPVQVASTSEFARHRTRGSWTTSSQTFHADDSPNPAQSAHPHWGELLRFRGRDWPGLASAFGPSSKVQGLLTARSSALAPCPGSPGEPRGAPGAAADTPLVAAPLVPLPLQAASSQWLPEPRHCSAQSPPKMHVYPEPVSGLIWKYVQSLQR